MQDLQFDLSKSLKVEVNGAIRKRQLKMNDSSNMKSGTVWALGRFDDPAKLQKRLSDRFRENLLPEYDRRQNKRYFSGSLLWFHVHLCM